MNDSQPPAVEDLAAGLIEQAELIGTRVNTWNEFGYRTPPSPDCKPIPPLGERSADAIRNGHQAIRDIDAMIAKLHALRGRLVSELRQDEDIRGVRIDAMLAGRRDQRAAALAIRMSRKSDGERQS